MIVKHVGNSEKDREIALKELGLPEDFKPKTIEDYNKISRKMIEIRRNCDKHNHITRDVSISQIFKEIRPWKLSKLDEA
jgi:hypothetical protein